MCQDRGSHFRILVQGTVQGVGFRPAVYALANSLRLSGFVKNVPEGVRIHVEGARDSIDLFLSHLRNIPSPVVVSDIETVELELSGYTNFSIHKSVGANCRANVLSPDLAICSECSLEILDSNNRRFRYPFTSCVRCGPRFSIAESLPYDRRNTSMNLFSMCRLCKEEYEDSSNRRFHSQINACAECGPHIELWNQKCNVIAQKDDALEIGASLVNKGFIVAIKGLGGFQLLVDATNTASIRQLRLRKRRKNKPFAVMFPSLSELVAECDVSSMEVELLLSAKAPIVLVRKKHSSSRLSSLVAPDNPYLGVMLPYTPLHQLLLDALGKPVVATSGNVSDEPICIDNMEALLKLGRIAEYFLVHNRPIVRHVDDSIVQFVDGKEQLIRLARGYIPLSFSRSPSKEHILAAGSQLKNSIAIGLGKEIIVGQYIGNLESVAAQKTYAKAIRDFKQLYHFQPKYAVTDCHPDYSSTRIVQKSGLITIPVQHHVAHALCCLKEHELSPPAIAVTWDGAGYGEDSTVWGGEFFLLSENSVRRVGSFRQFPLPGSEKAVLTPSRSAIGLLYEAYGVGIFDGSSYPPITGMSHQERKLIAQMLERQINSPLSSSVGRLFDAVASILGLAQESEYEGEVAMKLEHMAEKENTDYYSFETENRGTTEEKFISINWQQMLDGIVCDRLGDVSCAIISSKFHLTLAEVVVRVVKHFCSEQVLLSGGCFQNRYLTELTVTRLREEGYSPYFHQRIPPNDNGLAIGQMVFAETYLRS